MAYKLIWSPVSRDDLKDIVRFISYDGPQRAESLPIGSWQRRMLQEHPEIGRTVPEHRSQTIREIIFSRIGSSIACITSRSLLRSRAALQKWASG